MNANQALWEKGDFTQIAQTMRESGEAVIERLGVRPAMAILDLGCGDGTTAIPAARRGAAVLGVDIARNLVAAGNRRAQAEGLSHCRFEEGDACDLQGIENGRFDVVLSMFGAMFAPRPMDVAKEMVRVTRPGGRIVMGNWIPGDPTLVAQILKISAAYSPPPPEGFVSPILWGVEDEVRTRFAAAGIAAAKISFEKDTYAFAVERPPSHLLALFRRYYGPTMNAFEAAEKNGRAEELHGELDALFQAQDRSGSADATRIPATYLRVTVNVD
jgi:SAM-dependent methyltransferase